MWVGNCLFSSCCYEEEEEDPQVDYTEAAYVASVAAGFNQNEWQVLCKYLCLVSEGLGGDESFPLPKKFSVGYLTEYFSSHPEARRAMVIHLENKTQGGVEYNVSLAVGTIMEEVEKERRKHPYTCVTGRRRSSVPSVKGGEGTSQPGDEGIYKNEGQGEDVYENVGQNSSSTPSPRSSDSEGTTSSGGEINPYATWAPPTKRIDLLTRGQAVVHTRQPPPRGTPLRTMQQEQ